MTDHGDPAWVTTDEVVAINADQVRQTGETHFVRDEGGLEAAVMRPRHHHHYAEDTDVFVLASTLLLGIAQNHPFEQGNKRTAFLAMALFLEKQGLRLSPAEDGTAFAQQIEDFIVSHAEPHEVGRWLAERVRR